ncbi:MAG TPA: FtsX-like permease family protein, partial [Flavisolibacter sp.]|nr:FtsX-like permease family protein [Flavisolibacter sp.]
DRLGDWGWYGFYNYVSLKPGASIDALEKKYQTFVNPFVNKSGADRQFTPHFQPLPAIHLYSTAFEYDIAVKGNIIYVRVLMIIIAFILLIASFNFVNLAIARSLQRAKEVGVRKSIGASRFQLIAQFFAETFILTLVSALIAFVAACILLPYLNDFTGKQISYAVLLSFPALFLLILLVLVISVIAGIYPAIVLSGFKPTRVLKGLLDGPATKKVFIRQGLVVVQFVLSVLLIISAIVVIRQVNYMHQKELGFQKEQLLLFSIPGTDLEEKADAVRQELLQSPFISNVSAAYGFPGDLYGDGMVTLLKNGATKKTNLFMVDEAYLKTIGLQLMAGRDFSRTYSLDKNNFIINETAAKEFGFNKPQEAIGQTLTWPTWRNSDSLKKGQIVGVVKDFHYKSMHDKIEPLVLQIYPPAFSKVAVRIKTDGIPNALEHIKKVYATFSPDYPLVYNFLDERFDSMYSSEDKLSTLISIFTGITLFIASLGLLGLAAYSAERRRKELGIRKILGASSKLLVLLVSREFLLLVGIAFIIASPIAYYFMNQWLQEFAYRILISWWIFLIGGGLTLLVAFITVLSQIMKVTYSNPVRNLRIE